ncbi:DUF362 domain-containing protein [Methanonatronarchaeum sp. AMET-Sl]|uniref:DUF362 domain-containing protein n=1 Tax=Methanonatronarchaeum sp. AMET-Sl TaxID=3037654 RepID=UPI00244E5B86|nr:DUF362 domain-containing protein [Methanonatronarchaeum sp. AMET-Sl]WGI17089.1 DUF362 domain-containing protein [Methanonatronarchaeum sp. AMET-Sl]
MSNVYLYKTDINSIDYDKVSSLLTRDIQKIFDPTDQIAFKLHFGERESDTHLDPLFVKSLYNELSNFINKIVLMDCNVLYKSDRSFGQSHKNVAIDNGFDFAPIIIADGEDGSDELEIKINLNHFDKARIGKKLDNYNGIISIAHFTGHDATGIGGNLKNIGMGLGSKPGKLEMHKAFNLQIDQEQCKGCEKCIEICPSNGITIENTAKINQELCIGCGSCIGSCPEDAVKIPWNASSSKDLQERIVEYAYAALKNKKSYHINILLNITKLCDCVNKKQEPVIEDIGLLASKDIVAIDQASIDLTNQNFIPEGINPEHQTKYAEKIGLGKRKYKLIEL